MYKKILIGVGALIGIALVALVLYYFSSLDDKETISQDEVNGTEVTLNDINLNNYSSSITLTKGGTYNISGSLNGYILIDAEGEDVVLNLSEVSILSEDTGAIIGKSLNSLTINLDGTNSLTDGGSSDYDGVIFTNSSLTINGEGTLLVNGNQSDGEGIATESSDLTINGGIIQIKCQDDGINAGGDGGLITINDGTIYIDAGGDGIDSNKNAIINGGTIFVMGSASGGNAGIDTDDGYTINGGVIVALGSDMLERPMSSSKQYSLSLALNSTIKADTIVSLVDIDGNEIISFESSKNYSTIIISTPDLNTGDYQLLSGVEHSGTFSYGLMMDGSITGGELVSVNNADTFSLSSISTYYGSNNRRQ